MGEKPEKHQTSPVSPVYSSKSSRPIPSSSSSAASSYDLSLIHICKTTLTEKFLLYGGAIAQAGAVKGKKNARAAVSDWMEIEKQRGISVTLSLIHI